MASAPPVSRPPAVIVQRDAPTNCEISGDSTFRPAPLDVVTIRSLEEFVAENATWRNRHPLLEADPQSWNASCTTVYGYCYVDRCNVHFQMDMLYSEDRDGELYLNWRERMVCPICGLNSRTRASMQLFEMVWGLDTEGAIWIQEQVTPLYRLLSERHRDVIGSEFVDVSTPSGRILPSGIRHEDATSCSFDDASLSAILSFDVLEHVPDYRAAIREMARVLRVGGIAFMSFPFLPGSQLTRIRARIGQSGKIEHVLPAVFHGDPLDAERGVLCYQEFGWDVLADLEAAGFSDVSTIWLESIAYGYPNVPNMFVVGRKVAR